MAERLETLAFSQQHSGSNAQYTGNGGFNPRSIALDIRTPEELAAVNEFLLTLGRDVSGSVRHHPVPPSHSISQHTSSLPTENYFDTTNLSHLGLVGLPGLPPNGAVSYPDSQYNSSFTSATGYARNAMQQQAGQYGNIYSIPDQLSPYSPPSDYRRQPAQVSQNKYGAPNPAFNPHHYHHPTPPLETSSPHSTVSTPVNTTPPSASLPMPTDFDYLRTARGPAPVAHLAAPEYATKAMRPIIPLKSVPGATPATEPQPAKEAKAPLSQRGNPADRAQASARPGSIYPLLSSGDSDLKLPPLSQLLPRNTSRASTPSDGSPDTKTNVLPGLRTIASPPPSGSSSPQSDELSHDIGKIGLKSEESSPEERRRHADLILRLLVQINHDFMNRHPEFAPAGPAQTRADLLKSEASRDVQMAAA
jgi:hypothetical protein